MTDISYCAIGVAMLVWMVVLALDMYRDDRRHAAEYERHRLDHEYTMRLYAEEDSLWYDRPKPLGRATPCSNCQKEYPESVLKRAEGLLVCARCSPQAKAAARGFYEAKN